MTAGSGRACIRAVLGWILLGVVAGCGPVRVGSWLTPSKLPLRPAATIPAGDLGLDVKASEPSYELGEPVYLRLQLRNVSGNTVEVFPRLTPEAGSVFVEIRPPKETDRVYRFLPLTLVDTQPPLHPLAPLGGLEAEFPIFFGGYGWTFTEPGTWHVRAIYSHGHGTAHREVASAFVPVHVGAQQQSAGQALIQDTEASWEAGKFMIWMGGDHLVHGLALLDALRVDFPGTTLESHANFFLGHHWSWYGQSPPRPPDPVLGLDYLGRVRASDLPERLQIWAAIDEARCHLLQGDGASAHAALRRVRSLADGPPAYEGFLAEIDRLLLINP